MSKAAVKAAGKGDKLQQKSPAEFFAENKNIAGFDNVSAYQQHLFCCLQQPRLGGGATGPASAVAVCVAQQQHIT